MASIYDSEKIRQAAYGVRRMAGNLEDGIADSARRIIQEAEQMQGAAARAMQERFEALEQETRRICNELKDISEDLHRYAVAVEAVGETLLKDM